MGKNERHAYLKEIRSRYRRSPRQAKSRILDEFCAACGYHRKFAIRLLHRPLKRARRRIGRPPVYGSKELLTALKRIWFATDQARLPFALQGFDCDNGSEFLNYHLLRYFTKQRDQPVPFTRSRPYHKNDNAHVEQKNWSHVRQLFGYDRLERRELVSLMNALYANHWSAYQNHFCPMLKLLEKTRINSKCRKPNRRTAPLSQSDQQLQTKRTV